MNQSIVKTPWEITRIASCGGLSNLNREQRRYARAALQTMLDHGGRIYGHRCDTNVAVLTLTDFLYGSGRIAACSGTVSEETPHSWCEIDGASFEITYPLGVVEYGLRVVREWTLAEMSNYAKQDGYEYSQRPFGNFVCDVVQMMNPVSGNLPPEAAEAIVADMMSKRGWKSPDSLPGALAKIGKEVVIERRKALDAGPQEGESRFQLMDRTERDGYRLAAQRLEALFVPTVASAD